MTRGQITIITKSKVLTSIEFNGDMYMPTKKWAGHGRTVINALKRVNDIATYMYEVAKFNKNNHHYNDIDRLTYEMSLETLDFTKDYFENWFSDYVYIKNITQEAVELTTKERNRKDKTIGTKKIQLQPNAIAVLCFGELAKLIEAE